LETLTFDLESPKPPILLSKKKIKVRN